MVIATAPRGRGTTASTHSLCTVAASGFRARAHSLPPSLCPCWPTNFLASACHGSADSGGGCIPCSAHAYMPMNMQNAAVVKHSTAWAGKQRDDPAAHHVTVEESMLVCVSQALQNLVHPVTNA
eukprot:365949-Chlamydomonas_euryale.AAC.9